MRKIRFSYTDPPSKTGDPLWDCGSQGTGGFMGAWQDGLSSMFHHDQSTGLVPWEQHRIKPRQRPLGYHLRTRRSWQMKEFIWRQNTPKPPKEPAAGLLILTAMVISAQHDQRAACSTYSKQPAYNRQNRPYQFLGKVPPMGCTSRGDQMRTLVYLSPPLKDFT